MLKIITPEQWRNELPAATLIIEDDGTIYNGDTYYQAWGKQVLARMDHDTGYIFGPDRGYCWDAPIGSFRTENGVMYIYDSPSPGPRPMFCITGNRVYTYDEFRYKDRRPSAYVSGSIPSTPQETETTKGGISGHILIILLFFALFIVLINIRYIFPAIGLAFLIASIVECKKYGVDLRIRRIIASLCVGFGCAFGAYIPFAILYYIFVARLNSSAFTAIGHDPLVDIACYIIMGSAFLHCICKNTRLKGF